MPDSRPPAEGPERPVRIVRSPAEAEGDFRLSLLGAFELTRDAVPLALPGNSQRLLAFLGIRDRPVARAAVAGTLWPEASEERAAGSLRTLLSRLDEATRDAVQVNVLDLSLTEAVEVDLHDARALADRLLIVDPAFPDRDLTRAAIEALASDLLPDWYDDWAIIEAEQWHHLRVSALGTLAERLTTAGRLVDAADAARQVIAAEPLSEHGYAALIHVQMAAGDRSAALATLARCRATLLAEMEIEPSPALAALVFAPVPVPSGFGERTAVIRQAQTAVAGETTDVFEVIASGVSMEPTIHHGDTLLVSHDIELAAGRIVVAIHNDLWIIKRLVQLEDTLILRSDNANEEVALDAVEVQGTVVELRRTV